MTTAITTKAAALLFAALLAAPAVALERQGDGARRVPGDRRAAPLASDRVSDAVTGGLPTMAGVTPGRAELPGSAFAKLDQRKRGFLTREDTRGLEGFAAVFDSADADGDGRLDGREFAWAWRAYAGLGD